MSARRCLWHQIFVALAKVAVHARGYEILYRRRPAFALRDDMIGMEEHAVIN
jgi:hypothetical protein